MADWLDYKGIEVPDATPTGAAGLRLKQDLQSLVDWSPKSVWDKTANPGAGDDVNDDFYPGSFWLNTQSGVLFLCEDNTASAAVWTAVGSGGGNTLTVTTITSTTTLGSTHDTVLCNNSSDITVNLPAAATNEGRAYYVMKTGNNAATVTIDASGSETITSREGANTTLVLYIRGDHVRIVCDGSGWYVITYGLQAHQAKMSRQSSGQSLPDSTSTKIAFDTEVYDVGGIADPTTNDRFDIRRAGKYLVEAGLRLGNFDAGESMAAQIYINGTIRATRNFYPAGSSSQPGAVVAGVYDLQPDDYIELNVYQDSGSSLSTNTLDQQAPTMTVSELM